MKVKERRLARRLRQKGWSLRSIAEKTGCSKGSISAWIKDIPLSSDQIRKLKNSQDRGRAKAANHPNSPKSKWHKIRTELSTVAQKEIPHSVSDQVLTMVCSALYWAEGYKQTTALFVFANSDPDMIRIMMRFLTDICDVPKGKLRGRVNIYPTLDVKKAQKYWSDVSGIPISQFHQPLLAVSRASKHKRKTLLYGTFRIIISDVFLCSKIHGWINGLRFWASSSVG